MPEAWDRIPVYYKGNRRSIVGPDDVVAWPSYTEKLDYECEVAAVVGRPGRDVPASTAGEHVFGYTIMNDWSARDVQRREKQWARAKGFDTSCPLGPWVETGLDLATASDLTIQLTVDGGQRQLGRTSEMIHSIADLIVNITEAMTLLPGDVILTGTPAGVGPLAVGDEVAVTIEGIGTLTNKVIKRG